MTLTSQTCGDHEISIDCDRNSAAAYRAKCFQAAGRDLVVAAAAAEPPPDAVAHHIPPDIGMKAQSFCHLCNTKIGPFGRCFKCTHQECQRCIRVPSSRLTNLEDLVDTSLTHGVTIDMFLDDVKNRSALEDPPAYDGLNGSQQSTGTALDGSVTSGAWLKSPDSAAVKEGRGIAFLPASRLLTADQRRAQWATPVSSETLHPYILFCVPAPAVAPHGAYLSHICRKRCTGHKFFSTLNVEFDRLRGLTRWSKFWSRFRVIGCHEIKLVRVSLPSHLLSDAVS